MPNPPAEPATATPAATATTVVWRGYPHAPAPLAELRRARRRGQVRVTDDAGREVAFGPGRWLVEALRWTWFGALDAGLRAFAAVVVPRHAPPRTPPTPGDGPVVIVLPVLPDLSHTFVYRETLAMLRQRPDWRVVVLERNENAPVHPDAEALLARAEFLPRDGVTRRTLRVLRWLLTQSGRDLFALYRARPGGATRDLLGKNPLRDARHPGNAFALADWLRGRRPRALHVYGSTYAANVAMGTAILRELPFSITSYVDFEFAYAHRMLDEKVARATFFRVCTAFCGERLRALLPHSATPVPVIWFGLDLAQWQDRAEPRGEGVLVSAARLVPKKGLHLVPEALAELRRRGVAFRWLVAGDGPERARLEALCTEHGVADATVFLGARDNAFVRGELMRADAALLPCVMVDDGERDGIPIFLTEAMALGVPAVTTPISGIPDVVRDGDTGFLCTPGDSIALANKLQEVLGDPARAREVGERGRAEVHATHDVNASATALIARIEGQP